MIDSGNVLVRIAFFAVVGGYVMAFDVGDQAPPFGVSQSAAQETGTGTYLDEIYSRAVGLLENEPRDPERAAGLLAEAAEVGDLRSMLLLARLYVDGDGVPVQLDQAHELLVAAVAGGEQRAWIALAELYRTEGPYRDTTREAEALQQAVAVGDARSMARLAELVAAGDGAPEDFERARSLLADAISADTTIAPRAWGQLGDLYLKFDSNAVRAADAYQQAAALGHAPSMIALAGLLRSADGVPSDNTRAITLLQQAISADPELGVRASTDLALLYQESAPPHRDMQKAVDAYQQAVDFGDVDAMIVLARIVGSGDGVPVDFARATTLLEQASADPERAVAAWANLGDLYTNSEPPFADKAKAVDAYQRAADLGDPWSMISLAKIVGFGDGVPVDVERALTHLVAATEVQGSSAPTTAWAIIGQLYQTADEPWRDLSKAADAYQQAFDRGNPWSGITLARMIAAGEGVPRDFGRARALLQSAIDGGGDAANRAWGVLGDLYRDAAAPNGDPAKAVDAYQHAADAGDPWAMISLARLVGPGGSLPLDFPRMRSTLERAIGLGGPSEMAAWSTLGRAYRNAPSPWADPAKAAAAFQSAADLGDASSMIDLAAMIKAAEGVPFDFQRATALLEAAIQSGDGDAGRAWALLGDLNRDAEPPDGDLARAVEAYGEAANAGQVWSMIAGARLVGYGRGVPPDFVRARDWLQEAALNADAAVTAWSTLGYLYLNTADRAHRDPAKAVDAFRQASDLGDSWASLEVARLTAAGQGVTADPEQAIGILRQIAAANPESDVARESWVLIGDLHSVVDGPVYDPVSAAEAYAHGAALGDPGSMIRLGRMLVRGDGIPADYPRANSLLLSAAAKGGDSIGEAWVALGELHSVADWPESDPERALQYYQRGADAGAGSAHLAIAERMIAADEVSPRDRDLIVLHFVEAAKILGSESVGRTMFNARPAIVYAVVQQMLRDAGYSPGAVDGIYGPQTRQSAGQFCDAHGITSCGGEVVSLALLTGLLTVAGDN